MWTSSRQQDKRTVSVIVYGAKGLKSNHGKHKFAITCEVGSHRCRTEVVEELFGNPVFNKEFHIHAENTSVPLVLLATEKHERDILGQVTIPLTDLTEECLNRPLQVPLQPTKRCPTATGQLVFEAWISTIVPKTEATNLIDPSPTETARIPLPSPSGLQKLRKKFNYSPNLPIKLSEMKPNRRHSTDALIDLKPVNSCLSRNSLGFIPTDNISLLDASSDLPNDESALSIVPADEGYRKRSSLPVVTEQYLPHPHITMISPKEGSQCGGTVVTVDGTNLGLSKEDVVCLLLCGSDVLNTIEYVSPTRLRCTTSPWKPCVGNVTVETHSGGRTSSSLQFTFTESPLSDPLLSLGTEVVEHQHLSLSLPRSKRFGKQLSIGSVGELLNGKTHRQRSLSVGTIESSLSLLPVASLSPAPPPDTLQASSTDQPQSTKSKGIMDTKKKMKKRKSVDTPTGEVQHMMNGGVTNSTSNGLTTQAPKKPPRAALYICGQPVSDLSQKHVRDYDLCTANAELQYGLKESTAIEELKAQLTANNNQITELVEENETLKEQYHMLRLYIETLLMRAVDVCPQVLCVDTQ
jgi:hypothetical protein